MVIGPLVAREIAPHDGDTHLRRPLDQAFVETVEESHGARRRQAEVDERVARNPRHGADVGEVDRQRLPAQEAGGSQPQVEVNALDQGVGGEKGDRRRFEESAIVANADLHARHIDDTGPQARNQGALPQGGNCFDAFFAQEAYSIRTLPASLTLPEWAPAHRASARPFLERRPVAPARAGSPNGRGGDRCILP